MISEVVEVLLAKYFFPMHLPDKVMRKVEKKFLPTCICEDEEELDHDKLIRWALEIINKELDGKSFK